MTNAEPVQAISDRVAGAEVYVYKSPNDVMDGCPVQPLGMNNGHYFFASPDGEVRELAARDFSWRQILSLFAGDASWLCKTFPKIRKGSEDPLWFNETSAAEGLMRACHRRGLFSSETPLRGPGVWRVGSRAVLHAGDGIYYDGAWLPPGQLLGDAIYVARPALARPDFKFPLGLDATRELRAWLNAWSFEDPRDADLLFGFLGAALLGGFPTWRVHAIVSGERGCGKSSLGEYLEACFGPMCTSLNNYTEAGLRQSLRNEARPILLDEGEGDDDSRRMSSVITLLRTLSSGEGARIVRGSSGGQAQRTTLMGCVMLLAINPPHLEPQDRSRIVEFALKPPHVSPTSAQDLEFFKTEAAKRSTALRARALVGAPHFSAAFQTYRKALVAASCDGRQADMWATLLGGRSMLLDERPPTPEQADTVVARYADRLEAMKAEDREASDGKGCLHHLFDTMMDIYQSNHKLTVGQMLAACLFDPLLPDAALQAYGLRIMRGEDIGDTALAVLSDHVQLRKIYATTPWRCGGWHNSLKRLPGVKPSEHPVRVGGVKRRVVLIPFSMLPREKPPPGDL